MRREFWIGESISGWTAIEAHKAYQWPPNPERSIRTVEIKNGERILTAEQNNVIDRLLGSLEAIACGQKSIIGEDRFGTEVEADCDMSREELMAIAKKAIEDSGL